MSTVATEKKPVILLVDDEEPFRFMVRYNLKKEGLIVHEAEDGEQALEFLRDNMPDLVVLDLMLPEMSGFEICGAMQANPEWRKIPILVLSALDGKERQRSERLLNSGAGDYLTKPVSLDEFMARTKALLRRAQWIDVGNEVLRFADLEMETAAHIVKRAGQRIHLGPIEYNILKLLLQSPNRVFTRDQLIEAVWTDPDIELRTVDTHVRHLRRKLNDNRQELIRTVRIVDGDLDSGGYTLATPEL